jgi:hypothetical protein
VIPDEHGLAYDVIVEIGERGDAEGEDASDEDRPESHEGRCFLSGMGGGRTEAQKRSAGDLPKKKKASGKPALPVAESLEKLNPSADSSQGYGGLRAGRRWMRLKITVYKYKYMLV